MEYRLTQKQLEDLFFQVTALCLNMEPDSPEAQSRIRISWPTGQDEQSNPGWERDDSVIFLQITRTTDPYTYPENISYHEVEDGKLIERVKSTRCHQVRWICYGADAVEVSTDIRYMLMRSTILEVLSAHKMYIIPQMDDPICVPELFGGQWWLRCDLVARFYEGVIREFPAESIEALPNININHD